MDQMMTMYASYSLKFLQNSLLKTLRRKLLQTAKMTTKGNGENERYLLHVWTLLKVYHSYVYNHQLQNPRKTQIK